VTITDNGWDSRAWTDGEWLYREPRRPEVRPRLLAEAALLPWLAPQLPLPVPVPEPTADGVRHKLLVGEPLDDCDEATGTAIGASLGRFLATLHAIDPAEAVRHGATDGTTATVDLRATVDRMAAKVLPRLAEADRPAGQALLDQFREPPARPTLVHGDLGPEHVLLADGAVSGIIDWTDSHVGDPALDLSWLLHGASRPVAEAAAAAYGADHAIRERALRWHRLGPWHEVLYGLDNGQSYVDSGLAGVVARL
jgi:aminoglycoside phosphotransferase (APT) family kinase protein